MSLAETQTAKTSTPSKGASIEAKILLTVLFAVIAWGVSIFKFGVPGLYIPALAMVPVIYVVLIMISAAK